jgi:chaperonin GroES
MTHLALEPLFERIMILPDKVEEVTETGIVLPVEARKRPNTGVVISIGHLVESKCPIKVGDHVLYQRYSGLEVTHNGTLYHMVIANDLLGKFTSPDAVNGLQVSQPN